MNFTEKINSWIPNHFKDGAYKAYINMMGSMFNDMQKNIEDSFKETFIAEANKENGAYPQTTFRENYRDASYLDVHGYERCIGRVNYGNSAERDENYQNRVRRIKYNRTVENIKANIVSVTGITAVSFMEDIENYSFLAGEQNKLSLTIEGWDAVKGKLVLANGDEYGNYGPLDQYRRMNCFSILIESPIPEPPSFYDADSHYDTNDAFYGDQRTDLDESLITVLQTLIQQKIAAGCGYRLLAKGFDGIDVGTETQQENRLNEILGGIC